MTNEQFQFGTWYTIKTAPRNGDPILLCDCETSSMRWAVWAPRPEHVISEPSGFPGWRDGTVGARGEIVGVIPTHWMPLPPPPSPREKTND